MEAEYDTHQYGYMIGGWTQSFWLSPFWLSFSVLLLTRSNDGFFPSHFMASGALSYRSDLSNNCTVFSGRLKDGKLIIDKIKK